MNKIDLKLRYLSEQETREIDGIIFFNAALIDLFIDDKPSYFFNLFEHALIVFSELVRSLSGNGCYLIFTSSSGIADDGGWEGVNISFFDGIVTWSLEVDDDIYQLQFEENEYRNEINKLKHAVSRLPSTIKLEPSEVFFQKAGDKMFVD